MPDLTDADHRPGDDRPNSGGRPASTSAHALAAAAQRLFLRDGFDETSVDDIAAAVGVSRRTFFRYFATKADVVWVESATELVAFQRSLAASAPDGDPVEAVASAFIAALDYGPDDIEWERQRAELVLRSPAVQAQANAVYRNWRRVIAEFVAARRGEPETADFPLAVGHAVIAGSAAAHELWLSEPAAELADCLRRMFTLMLPRM